MCRGDDPDVDLDRVRIANALELPLLKDAQELCLKRGAHRADLVEKERALVRLFHSPLAGANRTGECAPDVAEQLRFEQGLRDGAAVQRDEPVRTARAVVVDGACGQLLSGPGLSRDHDGARGGGDRLEEPEQVPHDTAAAHQAVDAIAILEL